jgi:hypothetical protein
VWTQQGTKLVGSGAVGVANQGISVSLSADGNTAIVGGYGDNNSAGAGWVWTRSGGVWTQQGTKLVGSGAVGVANQGISVSLSADGNTAIVGGVLSPMISGAVWVWTRSGGVWTQEGNKLVGSGNVGEATQGFVSLSAAGNTAIVGGPEDNGFAGATWVWTRSGGVWTQQGTKLVGSGAVGAANQGTSVSLSADGETAIVGGFTDNSTAGAAWVFAAPVSTVPTITVQPASLFLLTGENATFSVTANGQAPLNYQWVFNGQNLATATTAILTLNSVTAVNDGNYSVRVSNAYGSITSASASLAVLTDGANGHAPTQISVPGAPPQTTTANTLVLITHGWEPLGPFADVSWISDMAKAIQAKEPNSTAFPFNWMGAAWFPDPDLTLISGTALGTLYAKLDLEPQHWQQIHFIAHSAGSAVVEAMAKELKASPNPPIIQETFLDPYTGHNLTGREIYGVNADWADDYFVVDFETDFFPVIGGWAPGSTSGQLEWAYNVDVGAALPVPFYTSSGIAGSTEEIYTTPSPSHGSPIDFYMTTIIEVRINNGYIL